MPGGLVNITATAGAAGGAHATALGVDTLVAWLLTAGLGSHMLSRWIVSGGLRRHRATGEGLAPAVVFAHFGLAITGLAAWISYLVTGWHPLAWSAVGVLMVVIGLGISTVTLLTPYPVRAPPTGGGVGGAEPAGRLTDEVLGRALTDDVLSGQLVEDLLARVGSDPRRAPRPPAVRVAALIPVVHGVGALSTFLLAVLTVVTVR